jgi:hypothetical protein
VNPVAGGSTPMNLSLIEIGSGSFMKQNLRPFVKFTTVDEIVEYIKVNPDCLYPKKKKHV